MFRRTWSDFKDGTALLGKEQQTSDLYFGKIELRLVPYLTNS